MKASANKIKDILMQSLHPLQFLFAVIALASGIIIIYHALTNTLPPDLAYLNTKFNIIGFALLFEVYAGVVLYCSLASKKHCSVIAGRYVSSTLGVMLWTITFVVVLIKDNTGLIALHIAPVVADAWLLAQLLSDHHKVDRRAL